MRHGKKIDLSPHQVSWLTRHRHSRAYIVILDSSMALNVYMGGDSVDICMDGPGAVQALKTFTKPPYDWEAFWQLTCPRSEV